MVPTEAQLAEITSSVQQIRERADLESMNALDLLADGLDAATTAYNDPDEVMPGLAVSEAFDEGIRAFANRCAAAGSSALQ